MRVIQPLGEFQAVFEWNDDQTEPVGPCRIVIEPVPDADPESVTRGISTVTVRQMSVGAAVREHQRMLESTDTADLPSIGKIERKLAKLGAERKISSEYLAWLSAGYVALVQREHRSVTKRLGEMAGKSGETIRVHLQHARAELMLTSTPGRAGGHLTPKARQILALDRPTT